MVRLTDRPDMTLDVYRRRKTTIQLQLSRGNYLSFLKWERYNGSDSTEKLCIIKNLKIRAPKIITVIILKHGTVWFYNSSLPQKD